MPTGLASFAETALVFAGGNALGAYQGGAYAAFAASREPDWVVGASVGAINAALIAGNPPERRVERLRTFWERVSAPGHPLAFAAGPMRRPTQMLSTLSTRLLGRPNVFRLSLSGLLSVFPGMEERTAVYDLTPLRDTLSQLIDLGRLNAGAPRLSALAVDVETGEEVVFDTARERLGLDHLIASASLIPDFPATRIGERTFVDGGLAANAPAHIVLDAPAERDRLCIVLDLFSERGARPRSWIEASERQTDLLYAIQTLRTLRSAERTAQLRAEAQGGGARTTVRRIAYHSPEETAMKAFDFARAAVLRRWEAGERDMQGLLETLA